MDNLPATQEMSRFCITGTICVVVATAFSGTAAEQLSEEQGGPQMQEEWNTAVLAIVSFTVLLSILVLALLNCTDCYKSEVSTECHPATASSGAKWGGADSYSGAGTSNSAGFTGEVMSPGERDNQPLPYTLIPSQVPEAQGFCGYAPVEQAPAPGLRGYGAVGGGGSMAGYGGGGGSMAGYGGGGGSMAGYGGGGGSVAGHGGGGGSVAGHGGGSMAGYGGGSGSMAGYGGGGGSMAGYGGGQGVAGYGSEWAGANTGGHGQRLPGAHVSPSLTQEPPPPYHAPSYS